MQGPLTPRPAPPLDPTELLTRARRLAGRPLGWVAGELGVPVPRDGRRAKGWAGMLLELALGASAGSKAAPDFDGLGIELKTIPVDPQGAPRQSTWVCFAPLDGSLEPTWEQSLVRAKLAHVLWVPLLGDPGSPLGERRVGGPCLWRPSPDEEEILRADWRELTGLIALGELEAINARHGRALQLRPKAASSRELVWALGQEGEWVRANPLGFYLRPSFTRAILARHLLIGR